MQKKDWERKVKTGYSVLERNIHVGFTPALASKSSGLSPFNKMCCISKTANVLSEGKCVLICSDSISFFNDRLTLIPHISGLSTQWQVHMVCFSAMHPNSTSQPHEFINFFPPTRICLMIWSRARTLGNQRRRLQMSGAAVILPRTSHKSCEAESDAFLAQHLPSRCILVYLCFSLQSQLCLFSCDAEAAKVKTPFTSLTRSCSSAAPACRH